jgi:xylose dehydrogenase (NAD/NADP)
VRWGIVSTAHINRLVIPGAHESPLVELVGVASRDLGRAEAYAREWGIERAYGSYEGLLADPDIEAVYISLPNTLHCEWSVRALEAGKHVLCEKPLSRHPGEVESAFDAADRAGRLLMEAFMYRHNPQTGRLAELVASGAIGELRLVRSAFSYSLYDPGNIRLSADLEGGALMDIGCYCVSGARLLAGEPETVYGQARIGETGTDWVFAGTMRLPGDVLAQFDCGTALPLRDELEAIGSEGSLFLDDPWHCRRPVIELRLADAVEQIELEPVDSYRLQLENLSAAIRGEAESLLGRTDALAQARALEALHNSASSGQPVHMSEADAVDRDASGQDSGSSSTSSGVIRQARSSSSARP